MNTRFKQQTTKRSAFHRQNQRHITNKDYSQGFLVTYSHDLRQNGKKAVAVFQVHVNAIRFSLYIFCILLQSKAFDLNVLKTQRPIDADSVDDCQPSKFLTEISQDPPTELLPMSTINQP